MPEILVVEDESAHLPALRALFREYNAHIGIDLCFQNFDAELAALPGKYAPPQGRLYLLVENGEPAGCTGFYPLADGICELKRLYIRPAFQRRGLARVLLSHAMEEAKNIGYSRMRLDSLERLTGTRELYRAFGFIDIPPYNASPFDDVYHMEYLFT